MRVAAATDWDWEGDEIEENISALSDRLARTEEEIQEATSQAFDRLWATRAGQRFDTPLSAGPWAELLLKYPDLQDHKHHGQWASGYYAGILAALRWAQGDGWNQDT